MNIKLVYVSPNGTTRTTTEVLKKEIERSGHILELIDIGCMPYKNDYSLALEKLKDADIAEFGAPAYHMDMLEPMKKLFEKIILNAEGYRFKAFFYLNYAGITSGKALLNAAKSFEKIHIPVIGAMKVVAPHFHHKREFRPENIQELVQNFYDEMKNNDFAPISRKRLFKSLSPKKRRVNLLYPIVHFIGKRRELQINVRQERCKRCGKCEKECPVGAISIDRNAAIDFAKCIHCYHCIIACKFNAVEAPIEKIDEMIKVNKRIIGIEDPQNQIYI